MDVRAPREATRQVFVGRAKCGAEPRPAASDANPSVPALALLSEMCVGPIVPGPKGPGDRISPGSLIERQRCSEYVACSNGSDVDGYAGAHWGPKSAVR